MQMWQTDAFTTGISPQILQNFAEIGRADLLSPPFHFLVVARQTRDIQVNMSKISLCLAVGKRCEPGEPLREISSVSDNPQPLISLAALGQSALKPSSKMNNFV